MLINGFGLTTGPVLAAILLLGAAALAAIWFVPRSQARRWAEQGIAGKELAELETGARGTIVQVVGGVALILTFAATWMQISDTRKATNRTLQLTATQQETERFTRAVEQLGSSRAEIRIGGIYGLEAVAAESSPRRAAIAQILLGYLQQRHRAYTDAAVPVGDSVRNAAFRRRHLLSHAVCDRAVTRNASPDDTQAAVSALVGPLADAARRRFKLARLDLKFLFAHRSDFSGADLTLSFLTAANLAGARFDRAILEGTDFTQACLRGASFVGASSSVEVSFDNADLSRADLSHSKLPASFRYADLRGADLSGTGLTQNSPALAHARIDRCTRLPWRRLLPSTCP